MRNRSPDFMKCPHCLSAFHDNREELNLGEDRYSRFKLLKRSCPECGKFIFTLYHEWDRYGSSNHHYHNKTYWLTYPKCVSRTPLPSEVPADFADDYKEACVTLSDSAKASAALSRRCLQHLLREVGKVKKASLADEIQEVLDRQALPSFLLDSLDAVRNIGNFAAHPIKSTSTGEVVPVEPGEAEWNLDVLESLFDFYFVQPALLKKKREDLNKKLKDAGKPPMK